MVALKVAPWAVLLVASMADSTADTTVLPLVALLAVLRVVSMAALKVVYWVHQLEETTVSPMAASKETTRVAQMEYSMAVWTACRTVGL